MISSVLLRQYDKYLEECEEPLDLFPAGKKSVKSLASFATNHFRFEVETETATDSNLSIELNGGAEFFVLSRADGEEHRFVSDPIRSDGFLRFNLGLYRLSLRVDETDVPLKAITASVDFDPQKLDAIYTYVERSQIFSAYIANYVRSNRASLRTDAQRETFTTWRLLNCIGQFMTAIRHLIEAEPRIFSRVREQRENVLWSEKVALTPEDLDWIVSSGPALKVSADGPVKAGGFRFSPDVVRQTTQFDSGNSPENMLINFVFESMRRELEDALKAHEKDPFKALSKQLHNLQVSHNRFKSVSGCERAAFHPTRLSSFSGSKSKLAVLRSINEWRALLDRERLGGLNFDATPSVTEVFEYFCFSLVVESLLAIGFWFSDQRGGEMAAGQSIRLNRHSTLVDIYYEPQVRPEARDVKGLFSTKLTNGKSQVPDIVVRVKNGSKIAYLILDAKFARSEHVDRGVERGGLASLLFFKYGLFLKTENGDPVDLVCALYPGLDGFALKDFKQSAAGSSSDPQLLSCALPARSVFEPGELRNIASKLFGSALAKVESLPSGPHKTAKVVITDAVRSAMDNRLESMGQNSALERIS